jgi:Ca2+-binding EF-hand superfamily protein
MALDDQLTPDQLDEMIGEIDTDGSGTVDFEGEQVLQCASVSTVEIEDLLVIRGKETNIL